MAFSWQEETVPSGTLDLDISIEYLDKSYIYVYLNQELTTDYYWVSDTVIRLNSPLQDTTTVTVVRRTSKEYLYIKFAQGAAFIKENLDTQNTQLLHLAQEMVEGRSIDGFYGDLSMNGYRITNLGAPKNPNDAVPKYITDALDSRTSALENSFIANDRIVEWFTVVDTKTDTIKPPFQFTAARVFVNGDAQPIGYSYIIVDDTILLAEEVLPGTVVHVFLGSPEALPSQYVTASEFAQAVQLINAGKASAGQNSDIKAILGLETALSVAQGGTGAKTAADARSNLGAAAAGANSDITSLSGLTTPVAVKAGGTGGDTPALARNNLGLSNLTLTGTTGTGTPNQGAFNADTTLTFSAAYSQAEHTTAAAFIKAIAQRVLWLEQVLRNSNIQKV